MANLLMFRWLRQLRYLAEYALVLLIDAFVRGLGAGPVRLLIAMLSRAVFWVFAHDRQWCLRNLEFVYGQRLRPKQRQRLARQAFETIVRSRVELLRWTPAWMEAHVSVDGFAHVRQAFRQGKGAILVGGHFGNYELIAAYASAHGCPPAWLYRPLNNGLIKGHLQRSRERSIGSGGVPRTAHSLLALRAQLRRGQLVTIAIDLNTLGRPVFVDFLGYPAASSPGAAALALATGAPVLLAMCVRTPAGRHHLHFHAPFPLIDSGDRRRDIRANMQQYMTAFEQYVWAHREQYNWPHARWRFRPDGSFWGLDTPLATMAAEQTRLCTTVFDATSTG